MGGVLHGCVHERLYFTGLAYSDVKNLTTDRLQTFFDGNLWIITRRKKTNTESNIRLLDVPKRIIEKYKGLARNGHVFPVPSNGSCNKILKDIGRQCGFKVRLTYHVARHTNATTVLLSHGVPIETVSRLLGHTNIKTTQIYAKITAQKISQDIALPVHRDNVPKCIIEKYKGLARDGHVFPVPSNGSCNKILKDIGRQCGFKVRLTYHVARHTNATTVLLSHGVPIETVSRLLGHTNIKTTYIARQGDIALPVHRDNVPFFFHRDSVFN